MTQKETAQQKLERIANQHIEIDKQNAVVILGLAHGRAKPDLTDELYDNEDLRGVEIWGLNDWHNCFWCLLDKDKFNFTRVYQIHQYYHDLIANSVYGEMDKNFIPMCNKAGVEVVTQVDIPGVNKQLMFPFDEAVQKFGENWFRSTMSYMIAHAILEGKTTIFLRRIMCDTKEEKYTAQRQQLCYAINWCRDNGIKIDQPFEDVWRIETDAYYWHNLINEGYVYGRGFITPILSTADKLKRIETVKTICL